MPNGQEQTFYQCTICNATFDTAAELREHREIHQEKR
jgi:DNA-directed RNA polymerase subunit RPC12/RpoP